jgi:hypothetical protein
LTHAKHSTYKMPQDRDLYGRPPPKKQKKEISLSNSLDFTANLTSLLSAGSSSGAATSATTTAARPRPSKLKGELAGAKVKRKLGSETRPDNKLVLKDVFGTEDDKAELARGRRKMEEKARLYAAMKRGDYIAKDGEAAPLVDFDRKWAEKHLDGERPGSSSGSDYGNGDDDEADDGVDTEQIEYTDEFGRLRRGTRADKERMERRLARGLSSTAELERMSARPKAPDKLIYGDAVQVNAFATDNIDAMEALARKRDRSATPPNATHFDASAEIRTKGVGFYAFSKDEAERQNEMQNLEEERKRTERERQDREEAKDARRKEVERRRQELVQRRAKKEADSFLDDLGANILDNRAAESAEAARTEAES